MAENNKKPLSEKWPGEKKAVRATQMAFDANEAMDDCIRKAACERGISPSDMIREIIGLDVSRKAKRKRLTVSLSEADYEVLMEKYKQKNNLARVNKVLLKQLVYEELREYVEINKTK